MQIALVTIPPNDSRAKKRVVFFDGAWKLMNRNASKYSSDSAFTRTSAATNNEAHKKTKGIAAFNAE
jgi:hypothetical protein